MSENAKPAQHRIRGYLCIAAAAFCWAATASMGKAVFTGRGLPGGPLDPLDPLILSQSRTTISLLVLAPLLLLLRGSGVFAMPARDVLRCLLLGVLGIAGSNFFYYFAIQKSNVSTAIIVQYTAPVWVLLYMVGRGREHANELRIVAVGAAVAGCALAVGIFGHQRMQLAWLGIGAALLAALSFSFYNVYGRTLLGRHERWKVMVYALLGASLFWLAVHPPQQIVAAHYSNGQWIFMLVFALLSMLIPFSFYFSGLHDLEPTRAIVTSCLEPVFAILIAATFLDESFGWLQAIGMTLVLAATVAVQMPERARGEVTSEAALTEHLE